MAAYSSKLREHLHAPKWLYDNVMFEALTGSVAYGVSNDTSDMDINGFCIPPKEVIFPHLAGEIVGFGTPLPRFECFQQHHVVHDQKTYDFTMYSIVKFFQLAMDNNPNIIELLFLPRRCILHSTAIFEAVREQRTMFLHRGAFHKYRGYAFAQMSKLNNHSNSSNPRRKESIEKFGFDTKFAMHCIRLLLNCEQILTECTITVDRHSSMLKSVRSGEWPLERVKEWFVQKELQLNVLATKAESLPATPPEAQIKELLMDCLEMHYGTSISSKITRDQNGLLQQLKDLCAKYD